MHLRKKFQKGRGSSPWTLKERLGFAGWRLTWLLLFRPTPKFLNRFRLALLRLWGCRITGTPFVSQSARIRIPWQLSLEDGASIGEDAYVYNLGEVIIRKGATVAQECLLCGGSHDFASPELELMVGDIEIGEEAFLGARACVLPGVRIGEHAIVGLAAVVTKDVAASSVVAGNPAKRIGRRGDKASS